MWSGLSRVEANREGIMSAFQCGSNHIGALVRFYVEHQRGVGDAVGMMAMLAHENARSLDARYPSVVPTLPVECDPNMHTYAVLSPVECLKACACLEYQSCETDDYQDTEGYRLLEQIRRSAIRHIAGYSDADWEVVYCQKNQREHERARLLAKKNAEAAQEAMMRLYAD